LVNLLRICHLKAWRPKKQQKGLQSQSSSELINPELYLINKTQQNPTSQKQALYLENQVSLWEKDYLVESHLIVVASLKAL